MSKQLGQLIRPQKNKAMNRLTKCTGKKKNLQKSCHPTKNYAALKKEIVCLKRLNENLKHQLQEQKLDYATLNRKYLHLETEINQLQLTNISLTEENLNHEKLIATAEPSIRSCMTRLVETSQMLAGLQMAFNRNRSQQQLSKISGSVPKTQSKSIFLSPKSVSKHTKNVNKVAPLRKQAVRPMVQGLQIFTNLTIPLQRIALPSQNSRSHSQISTSETPQESQTNNVPVAADGPGSVSFGKHRRNIQYRANLKSIPKRFVSKKDCNTRCPKKEHKRPASARIVPTIDFDDSSESEAEEVVESYLKPIVLIRDYFNVPCSKKGKHIALDCDFGKDAKSVSASSAKRRIINDDPLEGTSKMHLSFAPPSEPSRPSKNLSGDISSISAHNDIEDSSDSDSDVEMGGKFSISNENETSLPPAKAKDFVMVDVSNPTVDIVPSEEAQSSLCQVSNSVPDEVAPKTVSMVTDEQVERNDSMESTERNSLETVTEMETTPVDDDAEMCQATSEV